MFLVMAALAASMQQPATNQPNDDPVLCRRPQADVGTHMRPKSVCLKKSEWDLVEKNTQSELNRLQDRNAFNPGMAQGASRAN